MRITGAQAVVESLRKEGVDLIFGYPGGVVLPLYDAFYGSPIRHILTRHEQGAIHAADGYARVTGKVGVCIATSGPGATNLVTGLANAYMDSIPLVAITGQVVMSIIGKDSFQEADVTGITAPITKHNYLVKNPADLPRILREAFYIAQTGRPGPVVVDIPKDIFTSEIEYEYPEELRMRGYKPIYEGDVKQVEAVAEAIAAAQSPVFFVGGGVVSANAADELRRLVEKTGIPVVSSLMGLGSFPSDHPLFLGMVGMHGTVAANRAVQKADLLIGVGVRFDDRVTGQTSKFAPWAQIAHFDIDKAEINKNVRCDFPVLGHLKWSLGKLADLVQGNELQEWDNQVQIWKKDHPLRYEKSLEVIKPQSVIEAIDQLTQGEAVIVTDVGQHQMWAAQYYGFKHARHFVTSGGLGTMGFGMPAAIGAQLACPDKTVICVSGDGSIMMNIQELATAVEHQLPIKVAILNNEGLGMVRQWQRLFFEKRYSGSGFEWGADYVKIADAFGAKGFRATKPEEVMEVLKQGLGTPGPVFMDFRVAQEENVLPMVPAGAPLDHMIGG